MSLLPRVPRGALSFHYDLVYDPLDLYISKALWAKMCLSSAGSPSSWASRQSSAAQCDHMYHDRAQRLRVQGLYLSGLLQQEVPKLLARLQVTTKSARANSCKAHLPLQLPWRSREQPRVPPHATLIEQGRCSLDSDEEHFSRCLTAWARWSCGTGEEAREQTLVRWPETEALCLPCAYGYGRAQCGDLCRQLYALKHLRVWLQRLVPHYPLHAPSIARLQDMLSRLPAELFVAYQRELEAPRASGQWYSLWPPVLTSLEDLQSLVLPASSAGRLQVRRVGTCAAQATDACFTLFPTQDRERRKMRQVLCVLEGRKSDEAFCLACWHHWNLNN